MKRTKFETMLAFNRNEDLFPEIDDFFAFCDFLRFYKLTFEEVVNYPTLFGTTIGYDFNYASLSEVVQHFKECVSYYDNMGRTAETFARAFYLDNDYCTDDINELNNDDKIDLEQRVNDALNHTYSDTHIFESGEFIFYVGLC